MTYCFTIGLKILKEDHCHKVPHACCPLSHRLQQEKPVVSAAVPPAPVWIPSHRPLAPSVVSVMSIANVKGDLGAVHISPGICIVNYKCLRTSNN